jgi:hypothetical protein
MEFRRNVDQIMAESAHAQAQNADINVDKMANWPLSPGPLTISSGHDEIRP